MLQELHDQTDGDTDGNWDVEHNDYPHGDCPMSTLSVDTIQGKTTAGTVAMPEGILFKQLMVLHVTQVSNSINL